MARQAQDTKFWDLWQEAGDEGDDGIRRLLETVVQRVLDEELTAFLGAESHERTELFERYQRSEKALLLAVAEMLRFAQHDRTHSRATTYVILSVSEESLLHTAGFHYQHGLQ